MHKIFYASGFLYHSPTQQILLQQHPNSSSPTTSWLLFGGFYTEKDEPENIFKNVIFDLLHIKITAVNQIYSYINENTNIDHVIVYSELKDFKNFSEGERMKFAWFSFKEVLKLKITEQTKHDIVVGQRVIDAAARKSRGEHTFQ